jgi:hypothetical protein
LDDALIPQTSEEYSQESMHIPSLQLEHLISKSLSPLKEEMLSYHYQFHQTPFPKLIIMAQQGKIPKQLASLKGRCPICVACLIGQAHKHPWRSKSKQNILSVNPLIMHLENEHQWIKWSLLSLA